MKKQVPLIFGMLIGFFALAEFYVPAYVVGELQERLLSYGQILAAAAFVLGGINLVQVNWPQIRRRERDWPFKVILLATAGGMALVGVQWQTFTGTPSYGSYNAQQAPNDQVDAPGIIRVELNRSDAMVSIDGATPRSVKDKLAFEVKPGKHKVRAFIDMAGYGSYTAEFKVEAGQTVEVKTDLRIKWGKKGRVYTWLYDHVFDPCNSTMFALLAFFIASAAFRAFRARNTEAALLLGAAILVMLGRAPIGGAIHEWFPTVSDWIVDVPNNAGRRAIMMGAALGGIVTGLRVILGLERSHLGSD